MNTAQQGTLAKRGTADFSESRAYMPDRLSGYQGRDGEKRMGSRQHDLGGHAHQCDGARSSG
jgi:hypothetical protein